MSTKKSDSECEDVFDNVGDYGWCSDDQEDIDTGVSESVENTDDYIDWAELEREDSNDSIEEENEKDLDQGDCVWTQNRFEPKMHGFTDTSCASKIEDSASFLKDYEFFLTKNRGIYGNWN